MVQTSKFFSLEDEITEQPSVSGGSNKTNQDSRVGADGDKSLHKRLEQHKDRQMFIDSYIVRTLISNQKMMEMEKELETIKWYMLALNKVRRRGED